MRMRHILDRAGDGLLDGVGLGPRAHARWLAWQREWLAYDLPHWSERLPVRWTMIGDGSWYDAEQQVMVTAMVARGQHEELSRGTIYVGGRQRLLSVLCQLHRLGAPSGVVSDARRDSP